jgi:hypothetical protein
MIGVSFLNNKNKLAHPKGFHRLLADVKRVRISEM